METDTFLLRRMGPEGAANTLFVLASSEGADGVDDMIDRDIATVAEYEIPRDRFDDINTIVKRARGQTNEQVQAAIAKILDAR